MNFRGYKGKIMIFLTVFSCLLYSCKRKWTEKDRSEFTAGCLNGGALKDMGEEKARNYCKCMLDKIVERYPNRNDARFIRYDTTIQKLAAECSKQP
jgi:hypothetical protein